MYKMKCPICQSEMIYIKNEEMEKLDWVSMDCPKCVGSMKEQLVPIDNPHLVKEE